MKPQESQRIVGAGSGIRTHTEFPPMDFESIASARFRHPGQAAPILEDSDALLSGNWAAGHLVWWYLSTGLRVGAGGR